ncbi:MAG TPA: MBL fold metallo-hydrolase [Candidatus Baltobacteraceae bacterium]
MAELTFIGAAGTVTGSKHLIKAGGKNLFVDCGLFQGVVDVRALNDAPLPIAPRDVAAVTITHGHIDHCGYLPKFVKDGFSGPVYCTPATAALMQIVLNDAAHLQGMLAKRGFQHERPHGPPPYYDQDDVDATMKLLHPTPLHVEFDLAGVAKATFHNAAHILGSAFAIVEVDGKRALFSGDVGRYDRPLLYDPEAIGAVDVMVCESTYGGQVHPPQPLEALRDALLAGVARGGAIVIPAFAVERTQDILLAIGQIQKTEPRLAKLPIHLDSPMGEKVDDLFAAFPDVHKPIPPAKNGEAFGCTNLTIHITAEDSKRLNDVTGAHVIISASGMAAGGRVLHHLHNHLSDPKATIVFVGYQGAGTLGFLLVHGAHTIHILGDALPVRASIATLQGYSAHADKNDFTRWFATCTTQPRFYAVHGEVESAAALVAMVQSGLHWKAQIAQRGTTVTI